MATTSRGEPFSAVRLLAGAALGLGLAALSFSATADRVFAKAAPDLAQRLGIGGAAARAQVAERLLRPGASPAGVPQAEAQATAALLREPVNVLATRLLAGIAAARGEVARADRLYRYSEALSRRDTLTQVALVEERVRHDDIPGALAHYDRALRTDDKARALLFPVLAPAMSDPALARATTALFARRSAWGPDFLAVMAQAPAASPDALALLAAAARLRPGVPAERGPLDAVLARLVADGRYAAALGLWRAATGVRGATPPLRDGGFEGAPGLAPFDWTFADEGDLSATREPVGGGTALVLRTANGRSGELARQLLVLPAGRWRLRLVSSGAGPDPLARAVVTIACQGGAELLRLPLAAAAPTRLEARFAVPQGCAAQALTVAAPAGLGDSDAGVTLDDMAIVPDRG